MKLKNDGTKGKLCGHCGGYGFLNNLTGGSDGCIKCDQTGIELPDPRELQKQIEELQMIISRFGSNGNV